jgi:hypothetical protein
MTHRETCTCPSYCNPGYTEGVFLRVLRPYFRKVAGRLVVGSVCGMLMDVFIVSPALDLAHVRSAHTPGRDVVRDVSFIVPPDAAHQGGVSVIQPPPTGAACAPASGLSAL